MGIFIAIFVTLVVAGSILWIKPSKRDLRIARIRRQAMSCGMKVRLLDDKLRLNMFPWLSDYRGLALYEHHRLEVPEGRELRVLRMLDAAEMHELDIINRDGLEQILDSFADRIPSFVEAIVLYPTGIGLLWDEQGDEKEVREIDALLRELNPTLKI